MITVDAHQHFWRTVAQQQPWRTAAHQALERDFLPAGLAPELQRCGIDCTVLMQSVDEPAENDRLAEFATDPRVAGVVAWVPLKEPERAQAELARMRIQRVCGVRCLIADDPLTWLTRTPVLKLFEALAARGLAWDVVPITAEQTSQVIKLARLIPELKIVVDHLGRPPLDRDAWNPWADHVAELAQSPGVAMKVSVGIDALTAWDTWNTEQLRPYVTYVVEQFGADRLLLASNWPVVLLRAPYSTAWTDLRSLLFSQLPTSQERAAVTGGTAARVYGLDSVRLAPTPS